MQILLADAKIMVDSADRQPLSTPLFQNEADLLASEMARMDVDELARQLDCSPRIALENLQRYRAFSHTAPLPAILAYNGQAYKHLRADTLSDDTLLWAQQHLWITGFMYGLLRPMDAIVPYRMADSVKLQATDDRPVHQFWKDRLTDTLIESVKADDGILVHLSTGEFEHLFDWKRVTKEVTVVQPLFYVRRPDGSLRMQAVWAKTCRGAMVRFILEHRLTSPGQLTAFDYIGFRYSPVHGEERFPHFIRE